jgi:transcriptional regulator with XRE-family HTH domain
MEMPRLSPERRRLAASLKDLRRAAGLSGEQLGAALGWSQSKVSKIENARTRPSVSDVEAWANVTRASAELRSELTVLAELTAVDAQSWRVAQEAGLTRLQQEMAEIEAATTHLRNFQPALIPGLLQTAEYARRVLTLSDVSEQRDVPSAVAARLERQTVLYDQDKRFDFVLTEAALLWRPGPPELMHAQMDRLLSIETLPNVHIGVVPFGREATALYANGFTIFEVPDDPIVLVEILTTDLMLSDARDLSAYREAFGRLQDAAVTGQEARSLISSITA